MIEQYLTPALVVTIGVLLWRQIERGFDRSDKGIRNLGERLDRHLEKHP